MGRLLPDFQPGGTGALVLFANIGDLLLLEPCLRYLHAKGLILDLYCPRETASVWQGDPRLRRIVPLRSGNRRYEADTTTPDTNLPRDRYDFLFDFRPTGRSYRLLLALRARRRCTWQIRGPRRLLHPFLYNLLLPHPGWPIRRDRLYLSLLGLTDSAANPWLPARYDVDPAQLEEFRRRHPFFARTEPDRGSRTILIQPTARWNRKLWTVEHWRELIPRLQSRPGIRVGVVCGPDPRETGMLEQIADGLVPVEARFPGTLSWEALRCALAACDLFIGLDSAPYHLAAMLDRALVVLFGPTNELDWGPVRPHQLVVKAPAIDGEHSTANITVDAVLAKVRSVAPWALPPTEG